MDSLLRSALPVWLALVASTVTAGAAEIVFTKSFAGSTPEYVSITVLEDGHVFYKEAADEQPAEFQLEDGVVARVFALAGELKHFNQDLDSGLKVANTGRKTFRWTDGAEIHEAVYNFSQVDGVAELQAIFESVTQSEGMFFALERAVKYDRLGVNEVLVRMETAWKAERLVGTLQFVPLLETISGSQVYLNMAQDRAARLLEAIQKAARE